MMCPFAHFEYSAESATSIKLTISPASHIITTFHHVSTYVSRPWLHSPQNTSPKSCSSAHTSLKPPAESSTKRSKRFHFYCGPLHQIRASTRARSVNTSVTRKRNYNESRRSQSLSPQSKNAHYASMRSPRASASTPSMSRCIVCGAITCERSLA